MKRRNNYKFDNVIGSANNVSNINPYISYFNNTKNNTIETYSFVDFTLTSLNINLIKETSSFINECKTFYSKKLAFYNLRKFLNYLIELEHKDLNKVNYEFLYNYKIYLADKYKTTSTANRYYALILSYLRFLILKNYSNLHEDVLNLDWPKAFREETKSAFDKDLEHYNKSIDFQEYSKLIFGFQSILFNEKSNINEKIVSFLGLLSCFTGANPEVLLSLTFKDVKLLTVDFDTIEYVKIKNKKGLDCNIKIILKNYIFNNIKISDCSFYLYSLFLKQDIKENDLFFKILSPKKNEFILYSNYNSFVRKIIIKYNIDFKEHFNFSSIRKTYERHIYKITNNLLITSSLMGHSTKVASKNYLNTSAGIESHQKLAVTQDIIKGFSNNLETDNFVLYQKLLNLFDLDLESALKLAKKGFSIEEIILKAKRT